ncbi:MAG: hypothetical protein KME42_05195 [Tildeniella nuda ZEHNDER 1965/U140]|nr:hypothetical protein [Tildeniella nuda ZEHNDER 1965/U140]
MRTVPFEQGTIALFARSLPFLAPHQSQSATNVSVILKASAVSVIGGIESLAWLKWHC